MIENRRIEGLTPICRAFILRHPILNLASRRFKTARSDSSLELVVRRAEDHLTVIASGHINKDRHRLRHMASWPFHTDSISRTSPSFQILRSRTDPGLVPPAAFIATRG